MTPLLTDGKLTVSFNATDIKRLVGASKVLATLAELNIMGAEDAGSKLAGIIYRAKAGPLYRIDSQPTAEK